MKASIFDLHGQTAVVTGGTSGLGRALSLALASAGANVVASSRRMAQVEEMAAAIEAAGAKTLKIASDVKDRDSLIRLRDEVVNRFGKVEILVNCAGITSRAPTLNLPEENWSNILETNLTGTLRGCQVFGEHMLSRGYGRIVNIASLSSFVSLMEVAAYSASKAAVASLTKSLAIEWSSRGVMVNAIAPGVFRTDLNSGLLDGTERGAEYKTRIPLGRFGEPRELAGAVVFLASEAASYVTGEILVVDGGFLASGVNR